jgi:hypothetical protein
LGIGARLVLVPVEQLDDDFFPLKTRVAGEFIHKFTQYRRRLAILGEISKYVARSSVFAAFVHEVNQGEEICFVTDQAELEARLKRPLTLLAERIKNYSALDGLRTLP